MPTFQFLKNGHTVYRFEGAMQEALVYWIDSLKDRSNITPGDLAVLEEKAPQVSVVALLKRSAGMLLLPLAIILMVFLWSALYVLYLAASHFLHPKGKRFISTIFSLQPQLKKTREKVWE